ncbi:MAG: HPP family protein [Planctomycetota bacterium]|jgi:CBS-domain-containing membrane protein
MYLRKFRVSIDKKFKKFWKYYIWQSFLAAVALFFIVLVLDKEKMVVISAMGATAFIVFATPNAVSAHARNVIGGHLVGLILGMIFFFIEIPYFIEFPLVVGIAIFVMAAFDVEHPPAIGTALAVLINEVSSDVLFIIIATAIILSVCHDHLRRHLKDLV